MGDLENLNIKLQTDFDKHLAVIRHFQASKITDDEQQQNPLRVAIRTLLATQKQARKMEIELKENHELLETTQFLMKNNKIPPDLAIVAGSIDCLAKTSMMKAESLEAIFEKSSQIPEQFPRLCILFGIVDCLPHVSQNQSKLAEDVGQTILQILKHFNTLYFYQMKLLQQWLHCIETVVQINSPLLMPHGELVQLINLHWETPQMQDLPSQCMSSICRIWIAQQSPMFCDIAAKTTLTDLTWQSRSKYLILATLVPHIRFDELLCEFPDTVFALPNSLTSNCLLPTGTALFKALSKHLPVQQWDNYCSGVLIEALNNSNRQMRLNAVQYWLPCIIYQPKILNDFHQRLRDLQPFNWLAYVGFLKLQPHITSDFKDRFELAQKALEHGEEEVRSAALGLLLHSVKKTEPVSHDEWHLILDFVPANLHSDNPQFRLKLLSTVRLFLIRVLESCLSRLKKAGELDADIAFVRQFYDRILKCLHHGAGYQRKMAAMGVLRYILQLYGPHDSQAASLAKGASLKNRQNLIDLAGTRWKWTDKSSLDRYTLCLFDEVSDVRIRAADILKDFFSAPSEESDYLSLLLQRGLELCDSPRFQQSECGAAVVQLAALWQPVSVDFLVQAIETRFERLPEKWLVVAGQAPIHGFIGALALVLKLPEMNLNSLTTAKASDLIKLCQKISKFMLDALAGRSTGNCDVAPSFEEMGQAIDDIALSYNPSNETVTNSVAISVQQQMVLSCTWLNLKECGNLAVQLATMLLTEEHQDAAMIEDCTRVVYQVLVRCRHKGAIEAAGESLGLLCRRLFARRNHESVRLIPRKLLTDILCWLEELETGSSVTRRSAGLVFLVVKIVSSQPDKTGPDSLLELAVGRLIGVAQRPVEVAMPGSDLPQAIAIHLLKGLVHDASLMAGLRTDLMDPIVRLAVDLFSHPHWSVRNAALQLHGAVIPRLLGHAKSTAELFHKLPGLEAFLYDKLYTNDTLIPVLSLFCRLAPSGRDEGVNKRFSARLLELLGHSIVQVRSLAAQSLLAFVTLFKTKWTTIQLCEDAEILASTDVTMLSMCNLLEKNSRTNNLHGCLLAVYEFLQRCRNVALSVEDWETLRKSVLTLKQIETSHRCYYIRLAVLKLYQLVGVAGDCELFRSYEDDSVRLLHQHSPGFADWLRLRTELCLNHMSLNCILPAIKHFLHFYRGLDMVETALQVLNRRLSRLSSSSILANTVNGYVTWYINRWETYPSLLPTCLDFVEARGASALMESGDTSFRSFMNLFLGKCIETRELGTTTAIAAISAVSAVIKDAVETKLIDGKDELITRVSLVLLEASKSEESVAFRMAAAKSIKVAGRALLETADKGADGSGQHLFLTIVNLIQDEEKDVRMETAAFLTDLLVKETAGSCPRLDLMSANHCLDELVRQIQNWFHPLHLVKSVLELLDNEDILPVDGEEEQLLYEPEERNFFREQDECIPFFIRAVNQIVSPTQFQLSNDKVVKMLGEINQSLNRLPATTNTQWLFLRPSEIHSLYTKISARLTVISLCCPSWKTELQFQELQTKVQNL